MLTVIIFKVNSTNASRMGWGTVWSEGSLCLDQPVGPLTWNKTHWGPLLSGPALSCCVYQSESWALAARPHRGRRISNRDRALLGEHAERAFPGRCCPLGWGSLVSTPLGNSVLGRSLSPPETSAGRCASCPADLPRVLEISECEYFWTRLGALAGQGEAHCSASYY